MAQQVNPTSQADGQTLLREKQVLQRFPVSQSHWRNGVKSGLFPKGSRLSERITFWRQIDIDNLIASLV